MERLDHLIFSPAIPQPYNQIPCPHKFHSHIEEELIIPLRGNLEILTSNSTANQIRNGYLLQPGSFVYHSPGQFHTLRCCGSGPIQYLIFKWRWRTSHELNKHGTYFWDENGRDKTYRKISDGFRLLSINGLNDHTKGALRAHLSCSRTRSRLQNASRQLRHYCCAVGRRVGNIQSLHQRTSIYILRIRNPTPFFLTLAY